MITWLYSDIDTYNTKVFVYFNLHKKLWSIKALSGPHKGRVIGHAREIGLDECEFKVSQAGRARVLHERRKNVHAGVTGFISGCGLGDTRAHPVTYNPYKYNSFVKKVSEQPVRHSPQAYMVCVGKRGYVYI